MRILRCMIKLLCRCRVFVIDSLPVGFQLSDKERTSLYSEKVQEWASS